MEVTWAPAPVTPHVGLWRTAVKTTESTAWRSTPTLGLTLGELTSKSSTRLLTLLKSYAGETIIMLHF